MYATLGEEALVHGINETDVRFILADASLLNKLSRVVDKLPKVEHIIYLGKVMKKSALLGFPRRIQIHSMEEVKEIGNSPEHCMLFFCCCLFSCTFLLVAIKLSF